MSLSMYARETNDVAVAFHVDPHRGLGAAEAVRRSIHFGRNVIHPPGTWRMLAAIASRLLHPSPAPTARVLSDGEETLVNAADLVPGDVILVDEGADVPADARVITADALAVDESKLTGKVTPAAKSSEAVDASAPLTERRSMLYAGTHVVQGHGTAIVTATGDATELRKQFDRSLP